jgi:hypothetical protein
MRFESSECALPMEDGLDIWRNTCMPTVHDELQRIQLQLRENVRPRSCPDRLRLPNEKYRSKIGDERACNSNASYISVFLRPSRPRKHIEEVSRSDWMTTFSDVQYIVHSNVRTYTAFRSLLPVVIPHSHLRPIIYHLLPRDFAFTEAFLSICRRLERSACTSVRVAEYTSTTLSCKCIDTACMPIVDKMTYVSDKGVLRPATIKEVTRRMGSRGQRLWHFQVQLTNNSRWTNCKLSL